MYSHIAFPPSISTIHPHLLLSTIHSHHPLPPPTLHSHTFPPHLPPPPLLPTLTIPSHPHLAISPLSSHHPPPSIHPHHPHPPPPRNLTPFLPLFLPTFHHPPPTPTIHSPTIPSHPHLAISPLSSPHLAVRNVCWSAEDCNSDECCARPMLSANAYCMPLRTRGQVCDASPLMLSITSGVYFSDCPCHESLTCAALSNNSKSQCVDLRSLEIDYRRLAGLHNLVDGDNN
ncbi:hypothetical protein C7M84_024991 [Penaeus vannamei]|uniref:Prokineticin domain-containing protein n=1 Tax=Penaeus vannamei TaxID=6689 RepID=A0A3R7PCI0_PENVA|nr:hypothetical protein C7M84_024991 [Penaeus vannamei]